jgi:hypothetical protein
MTISLIHCLEKSVGMVELSSGYRKQINCTISRNTYWMKTFNVACRATIANKTVSSHKLPPTEAIGIYTIRHPGRKCRDIQKPWMAMLDFINCFLVTWHAFLNFFSHPCVLDSGKPCRNDGYKICVDTYALEHDYSLKQDNQYQQAIACIRPALTIGNLYLFQYALL